LNLLIHIDGAARGNPGPAAFGLLVFCEDRLLHEEKGYLGHTTNNVAEYTALVRALHRAAKLGGTTLTIHSDSELLVKQWNGAYRVKHANLKALYEEAKMLAMPFQSVTVRHVYREDNQDADRLCNQALDIAKASGYPNEPDLPEDAPARPPMTPAAPKADPARLEIESLLARAMQLPPGGQPSPQELCDQVLAALAKQGRLRTKR
jgi:ribonuclease HI